MEPSGRAIDESKARAPWLEPTATSVRQPPGAMPSEAAGFGVAVGSGSGVGVGCGTGVAVGSAPQAASVASSRSRAAPALMRRDVDALRVVMALVALG